MKAMPITVLLVEDDEEDIFLIKDAMEKSKLTVNLEIIHNGEDALLYIRQEEPFAQAKLPDLILLDLNIPKKNAWAVLKEIKTDPLLRSFPVTILTTSNQDPDIQRAYDMGCNSYVTKPVGLKEFQRVIQTIEAFWFTIVKLPSRTSR